MAESSDHYGPSYRSAQSQHPLQQGHMPAGQSGAGAKHNFVSGVRLIAALSLSKDNAGLGRMAVSVPLPVQWVLTWVWLAGAYVAGILSLWPGLPVSVSGCQSSHLLWNTFPFLLQFAPVGSVSSHQEAWLTLCITSSRCNSHRRSQGTCLLPGEAQEPAELALALWLWQSQAATWNSPSTRATCDGEQADPRSKADCCWCRDGDEASKPCSCTLALPCWEKCLPSFTHSFSKLEAQQVQTRSGAEDTRIQVCFQ